MFKNKAGVNIHMYKAHSIEYNEKIKYIYNINISTGKIKYKSNCRKLNKLN